MEENNVVVGETNVRKTMKDMTYKDHLALWTSVGAFTLGWFLVIMNFFIEPVGDIADSTLWVLGQSLVYCGSVIGISTYVHGEVTKIKHYVGADDK